MMMLLLLGANLYSCGKENFGEADIIGKGDASYSENDNTTPGEDGEIEEEKKEFIDTTDWSNYDDSTYLIGFGGVCEEVETVRATITMGDNETPAQTRWESGDKVLVYVPSKNQSGIYAYDATRKQFRPLDINNVVANKNEVAYAYYPASLYSNPASGKVSFNLQNGTHTTDDLGDKLPMSAQILSTSNDPHPTATFKNLCSILRVQLTGCETITSVTLSNDNIPLVGGGTVAWNDDAPTLTTSGGSKSITINLGNGILLNENNANEYYFILPSSGTSMSGMKVSTKFSQSDGSYTYTPTLTRSRSGSLAYGRSKVVKVALRAGFFSGGNGTEANPYQVATANDLLYLDDVSKMDGSTYGYFREGACYVQTADIDCSSLAETDLDVICRNDTPFKGTYDGGNFTIRNGIIKDIDHVQVGLFGNVHGTLKNIKLENFNVSSTSTLSYANTATLVGVVDKGAQVINCHSICNTVTGLKTGGLIGYARDAGLIDQCVTRGVTLTSSGAITPLGNEDNDANQTYGFCGGVIGGCKTAVISNCICYGAAEDGTGDPSVLNGGSATGGIAGYIGNNDGVCTMTDCYVSNAQITSAHGYAGGLVGRAYSKSSITSFTSADGSLHSVDMDKDHVLIYGNTGAGGVAGYLTGTITGTKQTNTPANYSATVKDIEVFAPANAGGIVGVNNGTLNTCYACASYVTTYEGGNAGGVVGVNNERGKLNDCIYRWMHLLSKNIYKSDQEADAYYDNVGGLVGHMVGGSIDNSQSTLASGYSSIFEGGNSVGGLIGRMDDGSFTGRPDKKVIVGSSTQITTHGDNCSMGIGLCNVGNGYKIKDIHVGIVDSGSNDYTDILRCDGQYIGGVVGYLAGDGLQIGPCTNNNLRVESNRSDSYIGGIVGYMAGNSQVRESRNNLLEIGNTNNNYVGGVVGYQTSGEVYQCLNYSSITAGLNVGGIAGYMTGGSIYQCYSASYTAQGPELYIRGNYRVGGLVGYVNASNYALIHGSAARSRIVGSGYNANTKSGPVGGLVGLLECKTAGKHATIANCVHLESTIRHNLTDAINIGGIVGYMTGAYALVQNCYTQVESSNLRIGETGTTQATTANNNAGGIAGYAVESSVIKDCYYRCSQVGKAADSATLSNLTKISSNAKNGLESITVTLSKDSKSTTGMLYEILSANSAQYPIVYLPSANANGNKTLGPWAAYEHTSNGYIFTVPEKLYELGTDFYLK